MSGKREIYQIKFEKMSKFCGACGFFGHTHLKCGSGKHDDNKMKWGDFLKVDWETWRGRIQGGNRCENSAAACLLNILCFYVKKIN
jgi:hypothetical protein